MDTCSEPRVRLEPAVSEEWLRHVVLAGHSPNDFASWVLKHVDIYQMLRDYSGVGDVVAADDAPPSRGSSGSVTGRAELPVDVPPRDGLGRWTKARFYDFLDLVTSVEDMAASSRLLGAYLRLGPIPSSRSLMDLCGFDNEGEWQTALRVAKQRITIQAHRMDGPPIFRRAKAGKESGQRLHPIEPLLFGWLKDWGRERTGTGQPEDAFPDPERWGWEFSGATDNEE